MGKPAGKNIATSLAPPVIVPVANVTTGGLRLPVTNDCCDDFEVPVCCLPTVDTTYTSGTGGSGSGGGVLNKKLIMVISGLKDGDYFGRSDIVFPHGKLFNGYGNGVHVFCPKSLTNIKRNQETTNTGATATNTTTNNYTNTYGPGNSIKSYNRLITKTHQNTHLKMNANKLKYTFERHAPNKDWPSITTNLAGNTMSFSAGRRTFSMDKTYFKHASNYNRRRFYYNYILTYSGTRNGTSAYEKKNRKKADGSNQRFLWDLGQNGYVNNPEKYWHNDNIRRESTRSTTYYLATFSSYFGSTTSSPRHVTKKSFAGVDSTSVTAKWGSNPHATTTTIVNRSQQASTKFVQTTTKTKSNLVQPQFMPNANPVTDTIRFNDIWGSNSFDLYKDNGVDPPYIFSVSIRYDGADIPVQQLTDPLTTLGNTLKLVRGICPPPAYKYGASCTLYPRPLPNVTVNAGHNHVKVRSGGLWFLKAGVTFNNI